MTGTSLLITLAILATISVAVIVLIRRRYTSENSSSQLTSREGNIKKLAKSYADARRHPMWESNDPQAAIRVITDHSSGSCGYKSASSVYRPRLDCGCITGRTKYFTFADAVAYDVENIVMQQEFSPEEMKLFTESFHEALELDAARRRSLIGIDTGSNRYIRAEEEYTKALNELRGTS